jgi:signal transduction histidine kinase
MRNMTRLAATTLFSVLATLTYSQEKTIRSINATLANTKVHDTVRLNAIYDGMSHSVGWSPQHIAYYKQLQPIFSKGLKQPNLNTKVRKQYLYAAGVYYYNVAKLETTEGDEKAPAHFDEAIKFWKASGDPKQSAMAMIGKGGYYCRVANWPKTFENYFAALKYYESIRNESGISEVNQEMGTACLAQQDWEKAIVYLKKALPYFDVPASELTISDRREIAVIHNNIGVAYTRLKRPAEAHQSFLKAYSFIKQNNDPQSESMVLVQLASSSSDSGNLAESQDYLKQALALSSDDVSRQAVYGNAARIYHKSKNYDLAAQYGELSYALSKKTRNIRAMTGISSLLYKIYKESGRYDNALKMHEVSVALKDSTNLEASKNELAQQELRYDFEKKEMQQKIRQQNQLTAVKLEQQARLSSIRLEGERRTALETSRNRLAQQRLKYDFEKKELRQKLLQGKNLATVRLEAEKKTAAKNNWLIGLSGAILALLLCGYFYYRNSRQKQAIALLEKNQMKQKLLVSQMNPHFIFNSISNIQGLIRNEQDADAINYLTKFSSLTRQILENSNENYISLQDEIDTTKNYMAIQQLLYGNTFRYSITVDDAIDTDSYFLPPMLTQPFIENAIKHGLGGADGGFISVRFYLDGTRLFFEVSDNGKGFGAAPKHDGHKSMAMAITKDRLASYTGNTRFALHTENIKGEGDTLAGAKVVFEIPYIYEN